MRGSDGYRIKIHSYVNTRSLRTHKSIIFIRDGKQNVGVKKPLILVSTFNHVGLRYRKTNFLEKLYPCCFTQRKKIQTFHLLPLIFINIYPSKLEQ